MNHTLKLLFSLCCLFTSNVFAYDFGSGSIDIPEGFKGPETKNVRDMGIIHEFEKAHPGSDKKTSIQITNYNFGQKLRPVPDSLMLAAAEDHLLDYLAGMRRHHDDFVYKKMPSRKIDGIPTAHVEWSGIYQGDKMHGTIYSMMKASFSIILHARDYEGMPYDNLIAAIHAMDSVKLKNE